MSTTDDIGRIYGELQARYDRISGSTISSVLRGKLKVKRSKVAVGEDKTIAPRLDEAEDAFKRYNCAIFTAFRGGYTLEENEGRNALLKKDMDELGMTYRPVDGCYKEADWEYPSVEYCYFAYNKDASRNQEFFENAYRLSAKYDQDSFLYKRAGINRAAFLVATTDAGRKDLLGDIKFAGQLYINVEDEPAWTDCTDGRFSFMLKGMINISTGNKKLKTGEGSVFDVEGYNPDGLLVMYHNSQQDMATACKNYDGEPPLVQHVFKKDDYSEDYIHNAIFAGMKKLRDQGCKRIGLHCSVPVGGSTVAGAAVAYDTVQQWLERYKKKVDWVVVVDTYGDYCKMINTK